MTWLNKGKNKEKDDNAGVTLSGDEQDKLHQIELENAKAEVRNLEGQVTTLQVEANKQRQRVVDAEAKLQATLNEKLKPERWRCLQLSSLARQHNVSVEVLNEAVLNGTSPGDFALQLLMTARKGEDHGRGSG